MAGDKIIAVRTDNFNINDYSSIEFASYEKHVAFINFPWEIFSKNEESSSQDY
jgi:hypothetical protein